MKVLITGGTGFVGSHTVRALRRDGHDVRMLVRSPDRVAVAIRPLGIDPDDVDVVTGDVTDEDAVRTALTGCEAVVHAAATYSWDPRAATTMRHGNVEAARLVLERAVEAGADPVVHVSSTVAVTRRGGGSLDNAAPMGDVPGSYPRSKRDSDVVARRLQSTGAPVVRVHPAGMLGPHDPHLSESNRMVRDMLRGLYPTWPRGRMPYGDVRDTADTLAAAVSLRGRGPSSWMSPGHTVTGPDLYAGLERVTGRRIRAVFLPGSFFTPLMAASKPVIRALPQRVKLPLPTEGAVGIFTASNHLDDSETLRELGVGRRDFDDTLRDTVAWLVDAGHLRRSRGGRCAG